MSPIRKILDAITRANGAADPDLKVRAFGKLPSSREFQHLDAGQGPAKIFADWIKSGHDHWVTCVETEKRGEIVPYGLLAALPGLKDYQVVARVWNSRDSASPPRAFPFVLFTLLKWPKNCGKLERLVVCRQIWNRFGELFQRLSDDSLKLRDLRGELLDVDLDESVAGAGKLVAAMEQTSLPKWLEAIAPSTRSSDPAEMLALLQLLVEGWREQGSSVGVAVRLPVCNAFALAPQVAAWLRWLDVNVSNSAELVGLFVPQGGLNDATAINLITRPISTADFQLLTTNAEEYHFVEDIAQIRNSVSWSQGSTELPPGARRLLETDSRTLRDWSEFVL